MSTKLNCQVKSIISTDYSDLEDLIKNVYSQDYEIMPSEEVGSSQYAATYTQRVKKGELCEFYREKFEEWKATGEGQFILSLIMQDLANQDLIPEGEYIIDVNW